MSVPSIVKKHVKQAGKWIKNPEDSLYYWFEHSNGALIPPEQVENVSREVTFPIVFAETVKASGFHKQKKVWYRQTATARIKDDVSQNIWIIYEPKSRSYFLRDLDELGFTIALPLFSTDILSFSVTEPEETDITEVKRLFKETSYIFGSVSLNAQGGIEDYITEVG